MKRLILFLIFCASLASAQLVIRNPGFLASLQPATAAAAWSSNNMTLWVIAEDLSGVADNGAPILWTNRIAGRLSLTNTTSGIVKSNAILNGKAAISFPGVNTYLYSENSTGTNWNAYVSAQAATCIAVLRQRGTKAQNCLFQWNDNLELISALATYDDVFYFDFPNAAGGRISGAQPAGWDDNWHVLEFIRDNGVGIIAVDGTNVVSAAPTGSFTSTVNTTNWIFGAAIANNYNFQGEIAEIRIFNVNIGSSERDLNGSNLSTTYGTPTYHRP